MLCKSYEHGGLKNVDISEKINSFLNNHGYKDLITTFMTGK